jgi:hypothetical protein
VAGVLSLLSATLMRFGLPTASLNQMAKMRAHLLVVRFLALKRQLDDEDDDASDDSAFVDEEEISFSESGSEGLESGSDDDDDDDDDEQRVYIKWDWSVCVPVGCVW